MVVIPFLQWSVKPNGSRQPVTLLRECTLVLRRAAASPPSAVRRPAVRRRGDPARAAVERARSFHLPLAAAWN
jgi:hypothetical protein